MDISLAPRILFSLGPVQITDALLGAFVVSVALIIWGTWAARNFKLVPTRTQLALETVATYLLDSLESAFGSKVEARRYFALIFTLLLYIGVANQFTLLPFVFEITYNGADALRQPTSDLGGTFALSLIVVVLSHVVAIGISPIQHLKNFFPIHKFFAVRSVADFFYAVVDFFIGFLNIIGEFAKVVSLAARLFGNIFAGNVMAAVVAGLIPFVVPLPFIAISIFSGFIQAFVFMLLSMQFIAITVAGARPEVAIAQE